LQRLELSYFDADFSKEDPRNIAATQVLVKNFCEKVRGRGRSSCPYSSSEAAGKELLRKSVTERRLIASAF